MKYLLLTIILLTGCILEGPRGPKGAQGDPGSMYLYENSGVLYESEMVVSSMNYWDIGITTFTDNQIIVTVHTRPGAGYMWAEPLWYLSIQQHYVRIFDDDITDPADEYRIIVGY